MIYSDLQKTDGITTFKMQDFGDAGFMFRIWVSVNKV
jgi:hypothetical protein